MYTLRLKVQSFRDVYSCEKKYHELADARREASKSHNRRTKFGAACETSIFDASDSIVEQRWNNINFP